MKLGLFSTFILCYCISPLAEANILSLSTKLKEVAFSQNVYPPPLFSVY